MNRTDTSRTTGRSSIRSRVVATVLALGLGTAAFVSSAAIAPQDSPWDGVHAAPASLTVTVTVQAIQPTGDSSWD